MMDGTDSAARRPTPLAAAVVASGSARLTLDEIAAERRRREPLAEGWPTIASGTLRNSDDQTVAAVAALRAAVARADGPPTDFEGWGVLAAPRFLGRSNLVVALDRFKTEGVWGVTPHLIPQFALHAQAGTLSLVLGGHGPNLGIGGGLFAAAEGVLSALTWLASGVAPGVWLVLTGWSPEYLPDLTGAPTTQTRCEAVALALAPVSGDLNRRVKLQAAELEPPRPSPPPTPGLIAERLEDLLAGRSATPPGAARRMEIGGDAAGRLAFEFELSGINACGDAT